MTKETEHRNPIEVLSEEFLDRRRSGELLSVNEFADSHPEYSDKIRRLFPAMLALETCKSSRLSASASSRPVDLHIESLEQLGDFRIVCEIGRGGMGVVYEAEQQSLQRRVAVKVFPRQALPDSRHLDRFHREARTAARLHHTNIVPVFGVGQQDDLHYYVMQRIDGISLDDVIQHCARVGKSEVSLPPNGRCDPSRKPPISVDVEPDDTDIAAANFAETEQEQRAKTSIQRMLPHSLAAQSLLPKTALSATRTLLDRSQLSGERLHQIPSSCDDWELVSERSGQPFWNAIAHVGLQIADALDYAHLQGVLHRDIKPSNLLLDHQGTAWITDFGLATALESDQQTHPEEVAGTLRFMAPEHIGGTQDARSDIYSLGLTLYELLTHRPAFGDSSRTMMLSKIMKGTVTPPHEIRPDIPKDLEAIVMRAMARDSQDRYPTAAHLANDLRRFIQGRPVAARPLVPALQLWRWTTRNPAVAMLCVALLLTGITSFFVVGAKWKVAVAENRRAEVNLTLALESLDQILERFTSSWMAHPLASEGDGTALESGGLELQMAVSDHSAEVLQDALEFYDRFAQQNPTNPQLYRDTAKVHRRVADIYQRLGQHSKAEQAYQRSLGFLNANQIASDSSLDLERAETLNQLGFSMYSASRFDQAEREFQNALSLLNHSPQGTQPQGLAQEARIRTNLAQCLSLMFRWEAATQSQSTAVGILERLVQAYPVDATYQLELARAYRGQYWLMGFRRSHNHDGDHERRAAIRTSGIKILERLVENYPSVPDYRCELSELLTTTSSRRHNDGGAPELERAVSLALELTETHPSIPRYRTVLAHGLTKLAVSRCEQHPEEAGRLFNESTGLFRSLTLSFPDLPVYRVFLVHALNDQAETLGRFGRLDEAREALKHAVEEQRHYVRLRPDSEFGKRFLANLEKSLAKLDEKNSENVPAIP